MTKRSEELEKLIEVNKPIIAERWRRLDKLIKAFYAEIAGITKPDPKEVPVLPVKIYSAITAPGKKRYEDDEPDPVVVGLNQDLSVKQGRRVAAEAYAKITYDRDDKTNKSVKCYGVIGVPMRLIHQAEQINDAKDEFKNAMEPISNKRMHIGTKDINGKPTKITRELSTLVLRQIQSSDVNLLAAYRHIPVIDEQVDEFRFMYVQTRSVARQTAQQLIDKLAVDPGAKAMADLARLRSIESDEFLVRPGAYYNRMRMRVMLPRRVAVKKHPNRTLQASKMKPAELPILFPMRDKGPRPIISMPNFGDYEYKTRTPHMEDDPFVLSLGFHRMKPEFREYKDDPQEDD